MNFSIISEISVNKNTSFHDNAVGMFGSANTIYPYLIGKSFIASGNSIAFIPGSSFCAPT
jgi:hypothetical protein